VVSEQSSSPKNAAIFALSPPADPPEIMSAEIYAPQSDHEKAYFDFLWDVANSRPPSAPGSVNLTGELSGLAAVTFFQRSGVDKGFLKQIWSLSTPSATMNAHQFYVALRFIAMIQNGEMPISKGIYRL
jgi:hypothetical protein